jgi:excisionase family DNA binding protein
MTLDELPPVLTIAEAATALRIGRNQCYALVRSGELHGRRIGRVIRIPKTSLIAFLEVQSPAERPEAVQPVNAKEAVSGSASQT